MYIQSTLKYCNKRKKKLYFYYIGTESYTKFHAYSRPVIDFIIITYGFKSNRSNIFFLLEV